MDTCCEDVVPTVPPQVMKVVSDDGGKLLWRHVLLHGRGTLGETVLHLCFLGVTPNRQRIIRCAQARSAENHGRMRATRAPACRYILKRFSTSPALQRTHGKGVVYGFEFVPYVDAAYTAQPYYGEVRLHGMAGPLGVATSVAKLRPAASSGVLAFCVR